MSSRPGYTRIDASDDRGREVSAIVVDMHKNSTIRDMKDAGYTKFRTLDMGASPANGGSYGGGVTHG